MADTPLLQDFLRAVFAGQEWRREFVTARRKITCIIAISISQ
jgi:hypothetical protein